MLFFPSQISKKNIAAAAAIAAAWVFVDLGAFEAAAAPPTSFEPSRTAERERSRSQIRPTARRTRQKKESVTRAEPEKLPSGPLFAVVSIGSQSIAVYDSTGLYARAPVSTGRKGYATPTGIFSILQKNRHHRSNIYANAPMPFMQRLTWSGIALHAGALPGYPASHGCIRLPNSFAQRLFGLTQMGVRVLVSPADVTPSEVAHARLPMPKLQPARVADAGAQAVSADGSPSAPVQTPLRALNPVEAAKAAKIEAAARAAEAAPAVKPAQVEAAQKAKEAKTASFEAKSAERALNLAENRAAAAASALTKAQDSKVSQAEAALAAASALETSRQRQLEAASAASAAANEADEAGRIAAEADSQRQLAAEAGKPAKIASLVKTREAAEASDAVKSAGAAIASAERRIAAAERAAEKAKRKRAIEAAADAKAEAEEDMAKAQERLDAAAQIEPVKAGEAASAREAASAADAAVAEKAAIAAPLQAAAAAKSARARDLAKTARKADADLEEAEGRRSAVERAQERADWDRTIEKAMEAKAEADAKLEEARVEAAPQQATVDAAMNAAAAARAAADAADASHKAALTALREAERRLQPVTVFVSRKTQRLYVRQGFTPVFDAPVVIRDAGRPLGTHTFMAVEPVADASLRWMALSMPHSQPKPAAQKTKKSKKAPVEPAAAPSYPPETPAGALDRIEISDEASARIAELAWVGASFIVSDEGVSNETGKGTDIIILTR